ncbi:MAG: 6-phosphogluconate dehydrogenase [Saprospiraceae bacterium]|nr:6-phosphogluconate dehydrogenase [Saprospiraceae bacterium]MBK8669823.1 6-phosphogluconate dehydrogenase [Saprospiraceae bacterium]
MSLEQTKQKAASFLKRLFWVLLIAFFAFSAAFYFYRTYTISEGTRTGILYKISKKGKLFKTYEGQLQLAGVTIMNKESSFEFSVENENIYSSMQNLEGKNVRLHYKQLINAFPWQGDTDYLVYKVEEVK